MSDVITSGSESTEERQWQRYEVSLPKNPSWIIEAFDPTDAILKYKNLLGIIESEHSPTVKVFGETTGN